MSVRVWVWVRGRGGYTGRVRVCVRDAIAGSFVTRYPLCQTMAGKI